MRDLLAQQERLTEMQRSVHDQFQEGGSILSVIAVIALILGVLLFAAYWARRAERQRQPGRDLSPQHLFVALMDRLQLPPADRARLQDAARHANLEHPTALLLSRSIFDRFLTAIPQPKTPTSDATRRTRKVPSAMTLSTDAEPEIAALRSVLFPD